MFDKYMVLTRGFQNVLEKGSIVGFQIKVRITYYRGVYLSLIGGFDVTVDGEAFKRDQMRFTTGGRTYSFDELAKVEDVQWPFGEPATLTVLKPGGLKPGIHDVQVSETIRVSYTGPQTYTTRRKITLVA